MLPLPHLSGQPRLCHFPVALDSGGRHTQHFRNLLGGQAAKKTQFDNVALLFIQSGEVIKGVVQGNHIGALHLGQNERGIEIDFAIGSTFGGAMTARVVHQNLPHQARGHRQKMGTIFGVKGPLVEQPQIDLMDQSRALQGMARTLASEMPPRDVAQLFVDQRNQRFKGLWIARFPATSSSLTGWGSD